MTEFRATEARALGAKTAIWAGQDWHVVPVIALLEGVIHAANAKTAEFVPAKELAVAATSWNGAPVVANHPVVDGVHVTAKDVPSVINGWGFGHIRNARMAEDGRRLLMEAWCDLSRLEELGHKDMADRARRGLPIEVSVGAATSLLKKPGNFQGKQYDGEWRGISGDHLAFLSNQRGACSIQMGCGAHRVAAQRTAWPDKHGVDNHGRKDAAKPVKKKKVEEPVKPTETKQTPLYVDPKSNPMIGYPLKDNNMEGWPKGLKIVGSKLGSNPGGIARDAAGNQWYMKRLVDVRRAQGEALAAKIYRDLGASVPTVHAANGDVASNWMHGTLTIQKAGLTPERANRILDHSAADMLLGNWDAVGLGLDNVVVHPNNEVSRVDAGGSLFYRAQGAPKNQIDLIKVNEWDNFANPKVNPYYAQVYKTAGLSGPNDMLPRLRQQTANIDLLVQKHGGWENYIKQATPNMSPAHVKEYATLLSHRLRTFKFRFPGGKP